MCCILTTNNTIMREIAIQIIENSFKGKTDKAGKPYVDHLYRVAAKMPKGSSAFEIVALLHDLLEDCPEWNEKSLRVFFTDEIVDSVVALTRLGGELYNDYIDRVCEDYIAKMVKKADLEDNMDITRIDLLTQKDLDRLVKYHASYQHIISKNQ